MSQDNLDPKAPKYKFKELKMHSSDEWMADATKKYRIVFDRWETTYLRMELSLFNKLFDEEEWEASIRTKSFFVNGTEKRELSNMVQQRKVTKDENIVYVRDSWGNATPGAYWLKGNYVWEAYIDEVLVGEVKFYIEDVGVPKEGENLFFDAESIKFFEGDANASSLPEKKYLNKFSQKDTRYLWGEFTFKNKTSSDYYAEIFFIFSDDAGQPKAKMSRFIYIPPNTAGQSYTVYPAWGSETPGTWKDDAYTMDVVFMDKLVATTSFKVGEAFEEGAVALITEVGQVIQSQPAQGGTAANKSLDDILFESLAELNALTGLEGIKTEVNEMVKLVRFYQESGKDVLNKFSLHTVFTGNPGTGKTTVARIMAKIYKGLGILEKGHLIEVDRQSLVAGYVGQTAIKTGEKINEAMGGILFIDEAYSLANEAGAQHDFGGESIQVILKRMEDLRGKFGVIVAGYTDNMNEFIQSNPGLRSRFDKYFMFEDTTDVFELLDKTEQSIFAISDSNLRKNYDNMKNLMYRAIQELQKLKEHKDGLTGVPTGFSSLDRMTSGWQNSDLVIIAARPGMGKTAFVVSAMRNAAVDFKRPVAIFSLEMASVQLVNRMISAEAELEGEKIRKGQLLDHEWQQLVHKTNRLSAAPIFIDDTPALSILELRAKCRRLKAEHNIELIIVDYLQLMRGDSAGNREQEIASISRALKGIAKELQVPVLALSQLSRGVETRGGDKRPQLSDLRESGSIEQDADIVMFLYRPEYYKITVDEEGLPTQGMGEVIIAKHRNGSTGTVKLKFVGKYTKFADFDSPIVSDNPFSGMITRESRLNAANLDEPPAPLGDDTPF